MSSVQRWLALPAMCAGVLLVPSTLLAQITTSTSPASIRMGRPLDQTIPGPVAPRAPAITYPYDPGYPSIPPPVSFNMERPPSYLTSLNYPWLYGSYSYGVAPMNYPVSASPDPTLSRQSTMSGLQVATQTGSAAIEVTAPSQAFVWVEGDRLDQQGQRRSYTTKPLLYGRPYSYEVRASWLGSDGRTVSDTRRVTIRAGDTTRVDFGTPEENATLSTMTRGRLPR